MKRYVPRLATVERVRRLRVDAARLDLAAALAGAEAARRDSVGAAERAQLIALRSPAQAPVPVALAHRQRAGLAARAAIAAATAAVAADDAVGAARARYGEAEARLAVIVRLDEVRRAEHAEAAAREEAAHVDDLVTARWIRERRA